MNGYPVTKTDAMRALGCKNQAELARLIGVQRAAVSKWPEELTDMQRDRVHAVLYRRGGSWDAIRARLNQEAVAEEQRDAA